MKRLLLVLLVLAAPVFAQSPNDNVIYLAMDSAYTTTPDTTSWVQVSPHVDYHLCLTAACDTANFSVVMDYRPLRGAATYFASYTVSDSTNYGGSAAGRLMFKSYDLTGDIVGAVYVRLRVTKMTTGGNVTGGAETYRAYLIRR